MCIPPLYGDLGRIERAVYLMRPSEEAGKAHKSQEQPNHHIKHHSRTCVAQTYQVQRHCAGSPSSLQTAAPLAV